MTIKIIKKTALIAAIGVMGILPFVSSAQTTAGNVVVGSEAVGGQEAVMGVRVKTQYQLEPMGAISPSAVAVQGTPDLGTSYQADTLYSGAAATCTPCVCDPCAGATAIGGVGAGTAFSGYFPFNRMFGAYNMYGNNMLGRAYSGGLF